MNPEESHLCINQRELTHLPGEADRLNIFTLLPSDRICTVDSDGLHTVRNVPGNETILSKI
jgi:hypothetical protein